jgi:hypothetical protein
MRFGEPGRYFCLFTGLLIQNKHTYESHTTHF